MGECPDKCHPLLFADGHFPGLAVSHVRHAEFFHQLIHPSIPTNAPDAEGNGDVVGCTEHIQEIESLKDEADFFPPESGPFGLALAHDLPVQDDSAFVSRRHQSQYMKQRTLAAAARSHHRQEFPPPDAQLQPAEHVETCTPLAEGLVQIFGDQNVVISDHPSMR